MSNGKSGADEKDYGTSWFPNAPREDMAVPITFTSGETRDIELRLEKRELRHIAGVIRVPEGGTHELQLLHDRMQSAESFDLDFAQTVSLEVHLK